MDVPGDTKYIRRCSEAAGPAARRRLIFLLGPISSERDNALDERFTDSAPATPVSGAWKRRADLDVRRRRSRLFRALAFLAAAVLATILRKALSPLLGTHAPFATYYVAVMFAAWYIGWEAASLMLVVGGFLAWCFFIDSPGSILDLSTPHQFGLVQYGVVGLIAIVLIEWLTKSLIEVRQREELLLRSEERLRLAQQIAHMGTFDFDVVSGQNAWTPELEAVHGLPPGGFAGTWSAWEEMVHPDDRAEIVQMVRRTIATGEPAEGEWRVVWPDGSVHWLAGRWQVFQDESGGPVRMLGVNIDITRRKQMDAAIESHRAEVAHLARVATVGELSASIAHELNQPLAAILSNAEAAKLLLAGPAPPLDEIRQILDDICTDDGRASDVIQRMRTMLPKQVFESKTLDVAELLANTVKLAGALARQRRMTICTQCDEHLPQVRGDRIHLQQVLLNLIINALDAMQECPEDRRLLRISAGRAEGGKIQVLICDQGPGIPPHQLPHLFKPFHTTKPNGTGMGLAIARTVIEAHGGKIWGENNSGEGATVGFLLPAEGVNA